MAPERKRFYYSYEDIASLTDKPNKNAIYKDITRNRFDPEVLESVVLYIARHGTKKFKLKILSSMLERSLDSQVDDDESDSQSPESEPTSTRKMPRKSAKTVSRTKRS